MSDDEGMGEPMSSVMSLDGWWETAQLSAEEQKAAQEKARLEMKLAVAEDVEYWERINSACMMDDPPTEEELKSAKVPGDFQDYAIHWVRKGKGLDFIKDFKAHKQKVEDRFERKQSKKKAKQRAEAMRLAAALGHKPNYNSSRPAAPQKQQQQQSVDLYPDVDVKMDFDPNEALAVLAAIDEKLMKLEDVCTELPEVNEAEKSILAKAYDHMMAKFKEPRLKKQYGYNKSDHGMAPLKFGGDVPSYFANVSDGSIYRRKVLSMAGLRNLIVFGPTIYKQLQEKHFAGDPAVYKGDVGLTLMRRVTGNVVDLDSTVLRCTDRATLNAINAINKHKNEKTFANSDDFAASDQAQEIAINCSLPMLANFAEMLKLNESQQKARKIHPSQISKPVPTAGSNTDRGKNPVWHYVNAGQNSFHANVPTMDDVNGALLKAPYHCLQLWIMMHTVSQGADLEKRIDDFFENCVVDSCFNMKWKAIEEFGEKMKHEGTIVYVLQRVQAENQAVFCMEFFEADNDEQENEIKEMIRLSKGRSGKDKTGQLRPITEADVIAWVKDPSIVI